MKTIVSTDTDKNSDGNYCAWAKINAGRVVSISDELGREGGELWSKSHNANGPAVVVMKQLARNWPNFYKKVRKEAFRDKLPALKIVQNAHIDYDANRIEGDIEELEAQVREKKRKLRKLKARKK